MFCFVGPVRWPKLAGPYLLSVWKLLQDVQPVLRTVHSVRTVGLRYANTGHALRFRHILLLQCYFVNYHEPNEYMTPPPCLHFTLQRWDIFLCQYDIRNHPCLLVLPLAIT